MNGWIKSEKDLKMYCFSPPVMLATFIVEICLALYALIRYKANEVGRLVIAMLIFLAAFQLAEYNVCLASWLDPLLASRLGYVAITMLPPLGIHLAYALAGTKKRPLLLPAYASAVAFGAFFLLIGNGLTGHACMGNYVIFQIAPASSWLYTLYYYGWLLMGILLCARLGTAKTQAALYGLGVGYLAFLLPTTAVNMFDASTLSGIPSIMCGFAVILAFILVGWVMPKGGEKRE